MKIKRIHNGKVIGLAIEGDLDRQGAVKLRRAFDIVGKRNHPLILDLQHTGMVGPLGLACLEEEAAKRSGQGGTLRVIRIPQRLQDMFTATQLSKSLHVDPFGDESGFIEREDVPVAPIKTMNFDKRIKAERCPQCKATMRPGAYSCIECGETIRPRRAPRHKVALPMLYRTNNQDEFVSGSWIPAITDDMDLQRFSGVGFFSTESFEMNRQLHLVFPTLQPLRDGDSCNVLVVFRGRVKNQVRIDDYHRVGLALFDYYEYEGAWEVESSHGGV